MINGSAETAKLNAYAGLATPIKTVVPIRGATQMDIDALTKEVSELKGQVGIIAATQTLGDNASKHGQGEILLVVREIKQDIKEGAGRYDAMIAAIETKTISMVSAVESKTMSIFAEREKRIAKLESFMSEVIGGGKALNYAYVAITGLCVTVTGLLVFLFSKH